MDIIIRIIFIGLVAFVPSEDGKNMTVIVERARDGHPTSDGHRVEPHLPLLFARATCSGDCRPDQAEIASFVYERLGRPATQGSYQQLDQALAEGGAWILDDVQLDIAIPQRGQTPRSLTFGANHAATWTLRTQMPNTVEEMSDFGWIAQMAHIMPSAARIDAGVLAATPAPGLVAARMGVDHGSLRTYTLAEHNGRIARLGFQPLAATAPPRSPRAYTHWVALDIPVDPATCEEGFEIKAQPFGTGEARSMTLKPSCKPGSVTELAIVNLPPWHTARLNDDPSPSTTGPHFELYYRLAAASPEESKRAVPILEMANPTTPGELRAPDHHSPLLEDLHLLRTKGVYSHSICIPLLFDPPKEHHASLDVGTACPIESTLAGR